MNFASTFSLGGVFCLLLLILHCLTQSSPVDAFLQPPPPTTTAAIAKNQPSPHYLHSILCPVTSSLYFANNNNNNNNNNNHYKKLQQHQSCLYLSSTTDSETAGLEKKTVAELKVLLRDNNLKVSGKKQELIERLQQHHQNHHAPKATAPTETTEADERAAKKDEDDKKSIKETKPKDEDSSNPSNNANANANKKRRGPPPPPPPSSRRNNGNSNRNFQQKRSYNNNNNNQRNKRYNNNNYNNNNNNSNFAKSRALNQKITSCESAKEILEVLASETKGGAALTQPAGGGSLNSVNFSTVIHRIARFLNTPPPKQGNNNPYEELQRIRAETFIDPRFALFLCSLAEALGGVSTTTTTTTTSTGSSSISTSNTITLGSREVSNIAWALAKIRIAPPQHQSPLLSSTNFHTLLLDTAKQVRSQVMQGAKARSRDQQNGRLKDDGFYAGLWVPSESLLCGHMIDTIGIRVEQAMIEQKKNKNNKSRTNNDDETTTPSSSSSIINVQNMAFQERANLLWAFAKAQRASEGVFEEIIIPMVEDMEEQLSRGGGARPMAMQRGRGGGGRGRNHHNNDQGLQPQEWSNSIWAFATAQVTGRGQVRLIQFLANTLDSQEGFREMFKPQELSNTAWSVAKLLSEKKEGLEEGEADAAITILRHVAREVPKRANTFKTQELSNTLWGFATLGFGSSTGSAYAEMAASLNNYVVLSSNDPEGDQALVRQATDTVIECAIPKIEYFKSQELNNLAWSLARLGRKDATPILQAIGTELWRGRRPVTPQDIGTTLWSMATLEFFDDEIYRGISSRLRVDRAHQFKPQELSNAIWAMATAEIKPSYPDMFDTVLIAPERQFSGPLHAIDDPITLSFGVAAQELMRRPYEFKTQEIKDVLWSFSRIGIRHPDLFKATAEHLVGPDKPKNGRRSRPRGVDDFSPQGLGNMAWAFAKQAQLVEGVNERNDLSASVLSKTGKMAVYATSFFDVGEILVQRLFSAIAATNLQVHENLANLKPQDISNTAWAMSVLGMKHTSFLEAAKQQLVERTTQYAQGQGQRDMTYFKSQEIANLLWAFAIVDFPVHDLGAQLLPYLTKSTVGSMQNLAVEGIARVYKRQELANIAWSLAVAREYPSSLMEWLYCGLVGIGSERDPKFLKMRYGDGGLQKQAIMSLIYLQVALEMDGVTNGLSLPESFPEGWGQHARSRGEDGLGDMGFELNLSTSKIQRDASAAFARIGFDHVEEHIIPLDELLENGGVGLANAPIDVISIDLANLESRIAIEVDGPAHYVADIATVPSEGGFARVSNGRMEYSFSMNGDRHDLNGPTVLKKRLMEQMGWKCINIPFWEWYDLNGDEDMENDFCRQLVEGLI